MATTCLLAMAMMAGCGTSDRAPSPTSVPTPQASKSVVQYQEPRAFRAGDWFEDATATSEIEFSYLAGRSGKEFRLIETLGGGVGFVDFDLDSHLDLYAAGGGDFDGTNPRPHGAPGKLFRQETDGRFSDATTTACLNADTDYSHGILAGDFDNDGFPDLFVTGFGGCQMWHNLGDGTFEDTTETAGLTTDGWHTAAAWVDLTADGLLDLFVVDYVDWHPEADLELQKPDRAPPQDVPPPELYGPAPDHLFLNRGDGRFEEVSARAGLRTDGKGLGVLAADFNGDGAADVYVANDVVGNHLYWGGSDFPLREAAELSGAAYNESGNPEGSMGVDAEDVNGDGLPDLWVTNFELEDNSLYLNLGDGLFQHSTVQMGLAGKGRLLVGFGTGFQDFDSDGWPDLYVLNGHVQYYSSMSPFRQPAMLFRNDGGRRFVDVTPHGGPWFSIPHTARGGAAGDWNNDGAVDLAISSIDEPLAIIRNGHADSPCLRLRLVGVNSPRDPIGATISGQHKERTIVRLLKSGSGYLSQSDLRIIIPLDPALGVAEISVRWPSGLNELFGLPAIPGDHVLVESTGTAID